MSKRDSLVSYSMADHAECLLAVESAEWTEHQTWLINHFQDRMEQSFQHMLAMATLKTGLTVDQRALLVEIFEKNLV